ncbi:MAG TPA: DMT family transporter [Alphaproteobacteria bacterium]|nr:DMT family transporter [Alphaproteobacteria bacterium]
MTATAPLVEDRRTYGIGILAFAQVFFAALDTSAKWLAVSGIPTFEIVFIRYAVHVVLLAAMVMPVRGFDLFRTGGWKLEILRGLCLAGVTVTNFFAMQFLPLTVTGALLFTMPLMICLLSVPLLGDRVGWRRGLAVLAGFVGILVIVRPGTEAFHPASLLCLLGALFGALYSILTRKLAGVDAAATQTMYAGLVSLVAVTPFAFHGWVWPSGTATWIAFFGAGVAGVVAHQLNTVAHRFATPSVLAPFTYLELLYLAIASWLVFGEPPDIWFYLGAPIIIGSGFYIFLRERQLRRPPALAPVED